MLPQSYNIDLMQHPLGVQMRKLEGGLLEPARWELTEYAPHTVGEYDPTNTHHP